MRISIAMATYNGARYIQQQLDSIAAQTLLPYELVVTDDHSTDDTLAIVERFAEHAPFHVRIHRNPERLYFAQNFMRAASLCSGDWITFCDQDDVWVKEKLEAVVHAAARPGVTMVVHALQTVDVSLRPIKGTAAQCRVRRGHAPARMPPLGYFAGLCVAFDASLMPLIASRPRFPDAHDHTYEAAHDKWVSSVADAVGTVRYIRRPLTLYRQHEANTCGTTPQQLDYRVRHAWSTGAAAYEDAASLASGYSETFARLAASPEGKPWRARLERAARRYGRTQRYLLRRAALYRAQSLPSRIAALAALALTGAYRFNPIRPPLHAFAKDFFFMLSHLRNAHASANANAASAKERHS